MGGADQDQIVCERCGKRLPRTIAIAGGSIRCSCGASLSPSTTQPIATEVYDLAPESPAAGPNAATRSRPLGAPSVRTLGYRAPRDDAPAEGDPATIRDLYMPLWLLGGGLVIEFIAAMVKERRVYAALLDLAMEFVVATALMFVAILLIARLRRISFGPWGVALLKLAAVSVAPAAAVALVSPILSIIPLGGLLGWLGGFVLYFALLGALFDLDQSDTWYCVCVIFLVNVAVYFLLLWIRGK